MAKNLINESEIIVDRNSARLKIHDKLKKGDKLSLSVSDFSNYYLNTYIDSYTYDQISDVAYKGDFIKLDSDRYGYTFTVRQDCDEPYLCMTDDAIRDDEVDIDD